MHLIQNECYHIYNRGNNKQPIFFNHNNYIFFIKKIREQLSPYAEILCYCLMPNHFHIIIQANGKTVTERISFGGKAMQEFSYRVGILLSSYSQAVNKQNNTTGSLFQQKTKARILSEQIEGKLVSYLENCFFYVHSNPFKAGLVDKLNEWQWSSYPDYTDARKGTLCNKQLLFELTGMTINNIINRLDFTADEALLKKIY